MDAIQSVQIVDLSSALPPEEVPTVASIWYDPLTMEVHSYRMVRQDGEYADLSNTGLIKVEVTAKDTTFKYADEVPAKNYYDVRRQMVIAKPKLTLSSDKTNAVGDGQDSITVTVECKAYDGTDFRWDELSLKCLTRKDENGNDIPGIAQVSADVLKYNAAASVQQFKVRSFARGKTTVKAKYHWVEGKSPVLIDGTPSFPISYGLLDLTFTNPGF